MLITVGVLLDFLQRIETFLLQRHYDGFMKKGRIRGRSPARARRQIASSGQLKNIGPLMVVLGGIFLVGIVSWLLRTWVL